MVEAYPEEDQFEQDGWGDDDDGEGWDNVDENQPPSNIFAVADTDML